MKLLLFIALGMAFFTECHLDELLDWLKRVFSSNTEMMNTGDAYFVEGHYIKAVGRKTRYGRILKTSGPTMTVEWFPKWKELLMRFWWFLRKLLDWIRGWLWFLYDRAAAMADEDVKEITCDAGEEG